MRRVLLYICDDILCIRITRSIFDRLIDNFAAAATIQQASRHPLDRYNIEK
jgi:hypothetical protein